MGGADKLYAQLLSRPLVAWTLAAFQRCDAVDGIVVVAAEDRVERMRALAAEWRVAKVRAVVAGADTRQQSVRAGLEAAEGAAIVAVHDGARPLVTPALIARGIELARESAAAVCAMPARDTVKDVEGDPPFVQATLGRGRTWLAQTPQAFDRALLLEAHRRAEAALTDDAALVEAMGREVRVYEGAPSNIKVTTPEDLRLAETLLRARLEAAE